MSQPVSEPTAARKPRRAAQSIVRGLLGILGVIVVVVIAAAIVLATGWPQRQLIETQLGKALKADVKAVGISILNPVRVANLKAFDKTPGADTQTPMIDLTGFKMAYAPFAKDHRYIPSVAIDTLGIRLDRSHEVVAPPPAPPASTVPVILEPPKRPSKFKWKFDKTRLIPKTFDVAKLSFEGMLPYAGFAVDGLAVKAAIESPRDYSVQITGDHLGGSFWAGAPGSKRDLKDSNLDIRYETGKKGTRLEPLKAALPGLLALDGGISYGKADDRMNVDLHFEKCLAQDVDLSAPAAGEAPVPFRFKKVDLSGTVIRGWGKAKDFNAQVSFDGTNINAIAEDLSLGAKDHEWYEGNLALRGKGAGGDTPQLDLEAELNRGQKFNLSLKGLAVAEMNAHAGLENWSRDDVMAALPKDMRPILEGIPALQGLNAGITLQIDKKFNYALDARLTPRWMAPDGSPLNIAFSFESKSELMRVLLEQGFSGTMHAQVGGQIIDAATKIGKARTPVTPNLDCKTLLQQWDPRQWVKDLLGKDLLAALDTRLAGMIQVKAFFASHACKSTFDVTAPALRYAAFQTPEGQVFSVKGDMDAVWYPDWRITGKSTELHVGDNASLVLKDYSVDFANLATQADATAEFDLALLSSLGINGHVKCHAPVENKGGFTSLALDLSAEGLGFGGAVLPGAATVTGTLKYDNANAKGTAENLQATLGAGTVFACPSLEFGVNPCGFSAPWTFQTDFQSLAAMGLLEAAKGTAAATCTASCADGKCINKIDGTIDAETLSLAKGRVAFQALAMKAAMEWGCKEGMTGSGEFQAAQLAVAGVAVADAKGPIAFEGDVVKLNGLQGALAGGTVAADITYGLLQAGHPVNVKAQLKAIDLARLATALPMLNLSGNADGELAASSDASGETTAQIDAASTGTVSVGTDALKLLLSSSFAKVAGKQSVDRVMKELLGKDGQCPFDGVKLHLVYAGGGLQGQIVLTSKKADLTIDLHVEPGALAGGLKMLS